MTKISTLVKTLCFSLINLFAFSLCAYAADKCPTLGTYMDSGIGDNFILKEAYETIANASVKVANFSWGNFAQPLQGVVGLGTAIYIAVYTLKNIGSFSQQDTAAYLSSDKTGVIPLAVKMGIVVWLLGNQTFLYKYLIGLAIKSCVEVGSLIGSTSGVSGFDSPSNLAALFDFVIKQIISFNNAIYKIVATGQLLLCLAFSPDLIIDYYLKTIPFAAALWIYGWIIIIGVSFYMLDVLLRLGVGCILLPFAVACGLSKLTTEYTRKTWNLFMNVCFSFIMLGIVIKFTDEMIARCIGLEIPKDKVLNEADIKNFNENLDLGVFVITGICCMVAYQLFLQIEQIVEKISGASAPGKVGQETGAKFTQLGIRAVTKPMREGGKFLGAGAQVAGKDLGDFTERTGRRISTAIKSSAPYRAISSSKVGRGYRAVKSFLRWNDKNVRSGRI